MKFTLSWLKEHLSTEASLDTILEAMTMAGLEVEHAINPGEALKAFTVAKIVEAKRHPNADKLQVCQVDTIEGRKEIVCGAPNARAGLVTAFAPIGTYVPGLNVTLEAKPVRGVVSNGMLCSAKELLLGTESDGILDLGKKWAVGTPIAEVFGLTDPVIDFEVTPNRPDWLGVVHIARELAAAGVGTLKSRPQKPIQGQFPCPVDIKLQAPEFCPYFAGRVIKGVKNKPSPAWLRAKLEAIGLRSINALVDVTNLLCFDRARPLHVYDVAKLSGAIVARRGIAGESLAALDGKTYALSADMCVIADKTGPLGLGGVMGGVGSGCDLDTTDVFIESAWFEPLNIFQTGRTTGIVSDAKYRFERGVDPASVLDGLERATALILKLCGGTPSDVKIAGAIPAAPAALTFDPAETTRLTGLKVSAARTKKILNALGFAVEADGKQLRVQPPSWRRDVSLSADLVEDIARIEGFDKLPADPLPALPNASRAKPTVAQARKAVARRAAANLGFCEAITWSFMEEAAAKHFLPGLGADKGALGAPVNLANPIASDLSTMRPSVIGNLARAAQRNADRGQGFGALFEIGPVFHGPEPGDQSWALSGIRFGKSPRHWRAGGHVADGLDIKADVFALIEALGQSADRFQIAPAEVSWLHPGRSAALKLGPKVTLGVFGELHPKVARALGVDVPVTAFELILDRLPETKAKATRTKPLLPKAEQTPLSRDFAFLVAETVPAGDMIRAAAGVDKVLIERVSVFDVYQGTGVPEGHKSVALEVRIQPPTIALTDQEIEGLSGKIIAAVEKASKGKLRV